jgi:hypothetical protein
MRRSSSVASVTFMHPVDGFEGARVTSAPHKSLAVPLGHVGAPHWKPERSRALSAVDVNYRQMLPSGPGCDLSGRRLSTRLPLRLASAGRERAGTPWQS